VVPKVRKQGAKAGARLLEEMRDEMRQELVPVAAAQPSYGNS
jgi:hypothetical protein